MLVIQRAEQTRQQKVLLAEAAKHPEQSQAIFAGVSQATRPQRLRIIPIILGIFGYTYGSLLGVFFVGMLTTTRGNDFGNLCSAWRPGFVAVAILSGLPNRSRCKCSCAPISTRQPGMAAGDRVSPGG